MKKKITMLFSLATIITSLMGNTVFAADSTLALNLLRNNKAWVDQKTEAWRNDGLPSFFLRDFNGDGINEIFILTGNVRYHAISRNYLVSFINGKAAFTELSGDGYCGNNSETGIFVTEHSGMGHCDAQVSRLNKDGTVSSIHNIDVSFDDFAWTDEDKMHAAADGNAYYIQVDYNKKQYYSSQAAVEQAYADLLASYNLQGSPCWKLTSSNYQIAANNA